MRALNNVVAVIGVGIMGSAIARNLIAVPFAVSGFDTDPARLSEIAAMDVAAVHAELARGAGSR